MNLFVRGLFASTCLFATVMFTGCDTTSQGQLNLQPRPGADVARFRIEDPIKVTFSGAPTPIDAHEEKIKEDGTITLPLIGSVVAVGKTPGELQSEIHDDYVSKYYVRLTVTVVSGERVYYVGGQVGHAGIFQYVSDTTVTKAIQAASGLNDFANHSKVWLIRASTGQRIQVDYDEALKNPAKDPPVYPNDQINVVKRIL
jgi:protein involved in polysaccharide export with SLBB domain